MIHLWCKFRFHQYQFSKNEAEKCLMGSVGWFQVTKTKSGFFNIPGGCCIDSQERSEQSRFGKAKNQGRYGDINVILIISNLLRSNIG